MNYVKNNWAPLLMGAALGYFLAKSGGVGGAVSKVRSGVKSVA